LKEGVERFEGIKIKTIFIYYMIKLALPKENAASEFNEIDKESYGTFSIELGE